MPSKRSSLLPTWLWRCALLWGMLPSFATAADPHDLRQDAHALSPYQLSEVWAPLFEALRPEEALEVSFHERRENDFRRGNRTFQGTLRVWKEKGISLHYGGTANVTLVVTPGTFWRRPGSGSWTAYPADPDSGLGDWSEPLWHLDLDALGEIFDLYGRQQDEGAQWELLLTPRQGRSLPHILMRGTPDAVTRVDVQHNPRRRTVYILMDADRTPSTATWEPYFPPLP